MPTMIKTLDGEAAQCMRGIAESGFLDGECYAFAIALSRGLGWPIVGLYPTEASTIPRHAAVYGPDKRIHDVRGPLGQRSTEFGAPFGIAPPYYLRPMSEDDLRNVRPVVEHTIRLARRIAEHLWPHLPWIESEAQRARAFADELEVLSRKHRLWIRGMAPAMLPLLAKGEDDEGGYVLKPTDDGMTFTIDRYLR